jgi:hypothetical protein
LAAWVTHSRLQGFYDQSQAVPKGIRHPALSLKDLEIFRTIGTSPIAICI